MKTLIDYIQVFDNYVSDTLCNTIIDEYKNTKEWRRGTIGDYSIQENIRDCDSIFISKKETIDINPSIRNQIDVEIFNIISDTLSQYLTKNSHYGANIQFDSGYSLLRYKKNQYIGQHIDASGRSPRELSCSLTLNDDYKGGEFCFFNREIKYNLKKGDIIIFPSNFMYPHEVLPILSGERYSIITWIY